MTRKTPLRWYSLRVWMPLVLVAGFWGAYSSCGTEEEFNLFKPIASPLAAQDNKARIEQAKINIDNGDYDSASDDLGDMMEDEGSDSNEVRLLYAAALLGEAELDVWSIISKILDSDTGPSGSEGGLDSILESFGDTFLGTGTEREEKTASLAAALSALKSAPYPEERQVSNTACLFAGMLAVPTLSDAEEALSAVQNSLQQISSSASNNGADCPDLDDLNDSSAALYEASERFSDILDAAVGCPFMDLSQTQSAMNEVESQLAALTAQVDKGCDAGTLTCPDSVPDCESLYPTCVQEALSSAEPMAAAGDGQIAACELVMNCFDPSQCFGGG